MLDGVTIHIDGLEGIEQKLRELPDKVERKHVRAAVSAGSGIVRDEMRERAPVYLEVDHAGRPKPVAAGHPPPGTLKRSVYRKFVEQHNGRTKYVVGVRHGKKMQSVGKRGTNLDAFYFFMVEFGTVHMPKEPFMRPAFDAKKYEALDAMVKRLQQGVSEEARTP